MEENTLNAPEKYHLLPMTVWLEPDEHSKEIAIETLKILRSFLVEHEYSVADSPENKQYQGTNALDGYYATSQEFLHLQPYANYQNLTKSSVLGFGGWVRQLYKLASAIEGGLSYLYGVMSYQTPQIEFEGKDYLQLFYHHTVLSCLATPCYEYLFITEADKDKANFSEFARAFMLHCDDKGSHYIMGRVFPEPQHIALNIYSRWPRVDDIFKY